MSPPAAPAFGLVAAVPYAALEAFEADNRSQMVYKVSGFAGELVSGSPDLPPWRGSVPQQAVYAALVDFYNDAYRGRPVRVAVLLQPVAGLGGHGMATIQVAETLELRQTLAQQLLRVTLWRQAALVALIAAVVFFVVHRALRPVGELSRRRHSRSDADLAPISAPGVPAELLPLVDAANQLLSRLAQLLEQQKRFVRDTSHQLRTPLAVLKPQVQSALRGDVDAHTALLEIGITVQRATELANQMPALAKVEQLRRQPDAPLLDWADIVRAVALDLSALIVERRLEFAIETAPAPVRAHEWALRELTRNLLHNALRHTPPASALQLRLERDGDVAVLTVGDSGPGIDARQRQRLFQPFSAGATTGTTGGSGLGLAICHDIVQSLGGGIELVNRHARRLRRRARRRRAAADRRQSRPMSGPSAPQRLRLDKWLWAARFYKTRALATDEIGRGRVEVNGQPAKPSRELRPGDSVALRQGDVPRTVVVVALSAQRGPAVVAQTLYAETPDSIAGRERLATQRRLAPEPASTIEQGRPTKRDRRQLADWDRWSVSVEPDR